MGLRSEYSVNAVPGRRFIEVCDADASLDDAAAMDDDMLHTVLRRRAGGDSVEQIQPGLIIRTGQGKGQTLPVASIYRALAEHAKREAYPKPSRPRTPTSPP